MSNGLLARKVGNRQTTAEIDEFEVRTKTAGDSEHCVVDLVPFPPVFGPRPRTDMRVDADNSEIERSGDCAGLIDLVVIDAVLGAGTAGIGPVVLAMPLTGIDANGAGVPGRNAAQQTQLVERGTIDRHALVDQKPVDIRCRTFAGIIDFFRVEAGPERPVNLVDGGSIDPQAFIQHDAKDRLQGQGLGRIAYLEVRVADRRFELMAFLADRRLVEHVERRVIALGKVSQKVV